MSVARLVMLCGIFLSSFSVASLPEEKAILHKLKVQQAKFVQLGRELQHAIDQLEVQINQVSSEGNEFSDAVAAAQLAVDTAKQNYQTHASLLNKSRLENAQFRYAIAVRRYEKSNPQLNALIQERDELLRAKRSNDTHLAANKARTQAHTALVKELEAAKYQDSLIQHTPTPYNHADNQPIHATPSDADSDHHSTTETPAANNKSTITLKSNDREHQAALAEAQRLRAALAHQRQQQITRIKQNQTIDAIEESANQRNAQPFSVTTDPDRVEALESVFSPTPTTNDGLHTPIMAKFLSIKTFENGNLIQRRTLKLIHLGDDIFHTADVALNAGDTALVVGSNVWRTTLPQDFDNLTLRFKLTPDTPPAIAVYNTQ